MSFNKINGTTNPIVKQKIIEEQPIEAEELTTLASTTLEASACQSLEVVSLSPELVARIISFADPSKFLIFKLVCSDWNFEVVRRELPEFTEREFLLIERFFYLLIKKGIESGQIENENIEETNLTLATGLDDLKKQLRSVKTIKDAENLIKKFVLTMLQNALQGGLEDIAMLENLHSLAKEQNLSDYVQVLFLEKIIDGSLKRHKDLAYDGEKVRNIMLIMKFFPDVAKCGELCLAREFFDKFVGMRFQSLQLGVLCAPIYKKILTIKNLDDAHKQMAEFYKYFNDSKIGFSFSHNDWSVLFWKSIKAGHIAKALEYVDSLPSKSKRGVFFTLEVLLREFKGQETFKFLRYESREIKIEEISKAQLESAKGQLLAWLDKNQPWYDEGQPDCLQSRYRKDLHT